MKFKLLAAGLIFLTCFTIVEFRKVKNARKKTKEMEAELEQMKEIEAIAEEIRKANEETKKEIEKYKELNRKFEAANDDDIKINEILKEFMDQNGIPKPWGDGSFSEFMRNPNNKLQF